MTRPGLLGDSDVLAALSDEERAWAIRSEARWRHAARLASLHPDLDVSDLYHALRCLEHTPAERLAAALQRGRVRPHRR